MYTLINWDSYDIKTMTEAWVRDQRALAIQLDRENRRVYEVALVEFNEALSTIAARAHKNSAEYRAYLRLKPQPPPSLMRAFVKVDRAWLKYHENQRKIARRAEERRHRETLKQQARDARLARLNTARVEREKLRLLAQQVEDATVALLARGLVLGTDFHLHNALERWQQEEQTDVPTDRSQDA